MIIINNRIIKAIPFLVLQKKALAQYILGQLLGMLYICVSFWLLAYESHDLSQAETKMGRNLVYCACCSTQTAHKPVKQSRQQPIGAYCPYTGCPTDMLTTSD